MPLSPLRRCGLSGRSCLLLLITLLGSPAVCRLEEAVNASDVIAMDLAYLSALNATLVVWRTPTQIQGQFFDPALPPGPLFTVHNPAQSLPELQAVGSHATYIVAFIDEGRVLYVTGNRTHQSAPLVVRPVPRQTPSGLAALGLGPGRARLFWVQSGGVHMALADPREGVAAALPIAALPAPPSAAAYAVGRAGAGPFALVHAAPGGGLRVQGPAEVLSAGGNATRLRAVGLGLTGPEAGLVAWVEEGEGEGCEAGCVRLLRFVGAEARAQRVLTGNATEGPVVLPGPDGFAVLWVDGASDIRHVTLSADLEIVQEQVVHSEPHITSLCVARRGTTKVGLGWYQRSRGAPGLRWLELETAPATPQPVPLTPVPTAVPTATRSPDLTPTATALPTGPNPVVAESPFTADVVPVLRGPTFGARLDARLLVVDEARVLLSWRTRYNARTAVVQGQYRDWEGAALSAELDLLLLHWGGAGTDAVLVPARAVFVMVYVDRRRVHCQAFNATTAEALLEGPALLSEAPASPGGVPYSASAALLRSDTVVAVWWQGETLFIRCFDVGDGSVTVSALYREPQGASPLPLGAYSPVAAYNDHLMFVAWTATETVEGRPVDTVRGGCFFASADSAPRRLHTLRVSASDAAGPGQPSVALLGPRFVVAWAHHNTTCRGCVYVRSYAAADGRPVPGVALAAAPPYGTVFRAPAITAVSETVFLVVWIGLQARECSLWGRVFVDHVPLEDRAFIIRRTAYSRCQAVASASAAGESVLALYNGDEALREGLELAILRNTSDLQVIPTKAPELVLLSLILSEASVDAVLLSRILHERGIDGPIITNTSYASGQFSVIEIQPAYDDLGAFLLTACRLHKLVLVKHAVVQAANISSVAVISTYGNEYAFETLCPNVPPPNRGDPGEVPRLDPSKFALAVGFTLGGFCLFSLVVITTFFVALARKEKQRRDNPLTPPMIPALSPLPQGQGSFDQMGPDAMLSPDRQL